MKIGIIDYGMGNLHSVANAFRYLGGNAYISSDLSALKEADGLILPGVGAFPDAMAELHRTGLYDFIRESVQKKPLLGICLGMQLLLDSSEEVRETEGLKLIHGKVIRIEPCGLKIPQIGWNQLHFQSDSPITTGLTDGDQVYFVHSYKASLTNRKNLIASTDYRQEVAAIIGEGNVFGCQFHPEKSGKVGLSILSNYMRYIHDYSTGN